MNIPLSTIQFEAYNDKERMVGLATIDLPDIEFSTTDIKGAGILGTISWATRGNIENLETTLHWNVLTKNSATFASQSAGHMVSLRAATEVYDAGTGERKIMPIRVDLRGHTTKIGLGKFEPGETMESELTLTIDWLKITYDKDFVYLEIDKLNSRYVANGQDIFADVNAALGR